jgi:hypothetical protein
LLRGEWTWTLDHGGCARLLVAGQWTSASRKGAPRTRRQGHDVPKREAGIPTAEHCRELGIAGFRESRFAIRQPSWSVQIQCEKLYEQNGKAQCPSWLRGISKHWLPVGPAVTVGVHGHHRVQTGASQGRHGLVVACPLSNPSTTRNTKKQPCRCISTAPPPSPIDASQRQKLCCTLMGKCGSSDHLTGPPSLTPTTKRAASGIQG